MRHPLLGCWLKIERANEHINSLRSDVQRFVTSSPLKVRQSYDTNRGELVLPFAEVPELPPRLSILVGEVLYQVRSALDHMIWQLIVAEGHTPPPKSGFPIFSQEDGYKARRQSMIKGVSDTAEARIRSLQPYHRGAACQDDYLWILQ